MSAARAARATSELAALARSIEEIALAQRFERCGGARAEVIVIEGTVPPGWFLMLVGNHPRMKLGDIEAERERVLRAGRALIVLDAGGMVGAAALDQVQWLFRCRPADSIAAAFVAATALSPEDRTRLAARARRIVRDDRMPAARAPFVEDGIFLLEPADGAERDALARWLAGAPAPAEACDRLALAPLLAELEQAFDREPRRRAESPSVEPASPEAELHVRDRILAKIDAAHDEIAATISAETARLGRIAGTEIAAAIAARSSRAAFAAILAEAAGAMDRRIAGVAREADADLQGAIEDVLADVAGLPAAISLRAWLGRETIFAGLASRLRGTPGGRSAPRDAEPGDGIVDKLLVATVVLAACTMPASPSSLIAITALIGAVGLYRSDAARALIDAAHTPQKAYDMLADSMREQARDSTAGLNAELAVLRRSARTEVTAAFAEIRRAPEAPPPTSPATRGKAALDAIIADLDI